MPRLRFVLSQVASLLLLAACAAFLAPPAMAARHHHRTLEGTVQTGVNGLPEFRVSLYGAFIDHGPDWMQLGSSVTDSSGHFRIDYSVPPGLRGNHQPVLFVEAVHGQAMLASAIGFGEDAPGNVIVNERTTVATANAYAQFIRRAKISGNYYGMKNAIGITSNLADQVSGSVGLVLSSLPNGTETSTFATFNSLTNVVAGCVADAAVCGRLIAAATPTGQPAPANTLQALSNVVKYPSFAGYPRDDDDPLFLLSLLHPIYQPALEHRPTSWLLFLKITGGFYSQQDSDNLMNGPGTFAIAKDGTVWADDNYIPQPRGHVACAGTRFLKFDPAGKGTAFFGGGLSGAGWGITLDPDENLWISNFGFQDPPCEKLPENAPHNSVSKFRPNGTPISPAQGFTDGNLSWPMGTVSDRKGNIWIANCGNDTITRYAGGDHNRASSFALGPPPTPGEPQFKPFGLVVDLQGNIWVTNNRNSTVSILSPQGRLIETIPSTYEGRTVITHPIGNAVDSRGNVWISNSDFLDTPCPSHDNLGPAENPSITLFQANTRQPSPGSPFTGGGLTLPWGMTVDGDDTVWVFNFGAARVGRPDIIPTGISRFCGTDTKNCPAGLKVGDPISPSTGYRSDAFMRLTGGAVDPSGNLWLADNWKLNPNPDLNPGGNAIVIGIGVAAPVKTPLIGPPIPFR